MGSWPHAFTGSEEHPPTAGIGGFEKEDFEASATVDFDPAQSGGNDLGVIEHEQVVGAEEIEEVGEGGEAGGAVLAVEGEQAGGGAGRGGVLGDAVGGEGIVKIRREHGGPYSDEALGEKGEIAVGE